MLLKIGGKKGAYDISFWPGYKDQEYWDRWNYQDDKGYPIRRILPQDKKVQNCFMFASMAEIAGRMSSEQFKQFLEDNFTVKTIFDEKDTSWDAARKEIIKPGDIIAYYSKTESGNIVYAHAAVSIGRKDNKVYIVERDADKKVYGSSLDDSIGLWGRNIQIWRMKPNANIEYYDDKSARKKLRTPFQSVKNYCTLDSEERIQDLINWISTRKKIGFRE